MQGVLKRQVLMVPSISRLKLSQLALCGWKHAVRSLQSKQKILRGCRPLQAHAVTGAPQNCRTNLWLDGAMVYWNWPQAHHHSSHFAFACGATPCAPHITPTNAADALCTPWRHAKQSARGVYSMGSGAAIARAQPLQQAARLVPNSITLQKWRSSNHPPACCPKPPANSTHPWPLTTKLLVLLTPLNLPVHRLWSRPTC